MFSVKLKIRLTKRIFTQALLQSFNIIVHALLNSLINK